MTLQAMMEDAQAIAARIGGKMGALPITDEDLDAHRSRKPTPRVTERQRQVQALRAKGMDRTQIANVLGLPVHTVKNDLYSKIDRG